MAKPIHQFDDDCFLDNTDTCVVCGVYHGDPCPRCGRRAFHSPSCPNNEAERIKREKRNARARAARRARADAYDSCGMVRVRGNLGGTYYE